MSKFLQLRHNKIVNFQDTLSILGFFHKKLVPTSASTYCQNRWKLGKNYNDQFVRVRFSGPGSNTNKEQGTDPIKERKPSFQQAESLGTKAAYFYYFSTNPCKYEVRVKTL